jgi:hypothetical protein
MRNPIRRGIFTPSELHRMARRLDRRVNAVNTALTAMKQGAALHLFYERGHPTWKLSNGTFIAPETADAVINNPRVAGVGDALFPDHPSQTWRYIND